MRLILATIAVALLASTSSAATITFDGLPAGNIGGPSVFTEGEFDMLIVDGYGGPDGSGKEYERLWGSAGTLEVVLSGGGAFMFSSIDWQAEGGSGTPSITLEGFLGAALLATDTFSTSSSAYTTFGASNLAGLHIDKLVIKADRTSGTMGAANDLVLTPEPSSAALLALGIVGIGAVRRRRKRVDSA